VLIEFPHAGSKTIAFLTNQVTGEIASKLNGDHVSVYVPTTPNPTSGYMLIIPKDHVYELHMSVDQALKYIVSMGVAAPPPEPSTVQPLDALADTRDPNTSNANR
jgi:uncharacterized membrane protein